MNCPRCNNHHITIRSDGASCGLCLHWWQVASCRFRVGRGKEGVKQAGAGTPGEPEVFQFSNSNDSTNELSTL